MAGIGSAAAASSAAIFGPAARPSAAQPAISRILTKVGGGAPACSASCVNSGACAVQATVSGRPVASAAMKRSSCAMQSCSAVRNSAPQPRAMAFSSRRMVSSQLHTRAIRPSDPLIDRNFPPHAPAGPERHVAYMPCITMLRGSAVSEGLSDLPSVFTPIVALREGGDAMTRATAMAPEHGAGTLVWVRSWARVEAAVVLEPEQTLAAARPALLAALTAAGDALGAFGPPEQPMTFDWPATIRLNGGVVGRAQLAVPPGCAEDAVPDWLVVGIEIAFAAGIDAEPGHDPGRTTLFEEGYDDTTPAELTATWARHLMATLADWQAGGFRLVAERYLARLDPTLAEGARRGIDPANGDLLIQHDGRRERLPLAMAVAA